MMQGLSVWKQLYCKRSEQLFPLRGGTAKQTTVQLPSVCIISGKCPGIAYVDVLLNFSGLGGKHWGRATCV